MRNKAIKKVIEIIEKNKYFILLEFSIGFFILGFMTTFVSGFHTFDMGQNFEFLFDDIDFDMYRQGCVFDRNNYLETTLGGNYIDISSMYVSGLQSTFVGIAELISSSILLGYSLKGVKDDKHRH